MKISLSARIAAAIFSVGTTFALVALIAAYAYPDARREEQQALAVSPP